jgi:hypothetical protein
MMPGAVERGSIQGTQEGKLPSTRPWSSSWIGHYDEASRRRHRMGGYRRLRAEAKRKRRVERIILVVTTTSVLVLVAIFYSILSG